MSTPRDRDDFDDRRDDVPGWHEPAHLGGENADAPPAPVEPAAPRPGRGSLGAGGMWRLRGDAARVFADEGDVFGAQAWALSHGWSIGDGTAPEDAGLQALIDSAPVRPSKEDRAGGVLRGRGGALELVAFDVVYPLRNTWVPRYAITAAPLLVPVPGFRLSPARLWKHRTAGLIPLPSGNETFDARWVLLAAEDDPRLHRLVEDPAVQSLLLGSDDGDEFWSAAGHVAVIRPDAHRPQLIEHHARLLGAVVPALTASD